MIIKGDKIKLAQKIGNFDKVGDVFEVTGVDNGVVSFKCNYGTGCMSYDEFEKYFEKVKPVVKKPWTDWKEVYGGYTYLNPFEDGEEYIDFPIAYRTNGKKIQVKSNGYKAESTCCNGDIFDFDTGYELVRRRLIAKLICGQVEAYAKSL